MDHANLRALRASSALAALVVVLAGCSSGSGGSSVGSSSNKTPIARALVVNSGATNTVREGAEVLLSARDSEDPDGPLLDWTWTAPAGVDLITRSRTTASFTAPKVDAETSFTFSVTVVDSDNATDTTSIDVTVVPARDPNAFLTPRATQSVDSFTVTPALEPGASAGLLDVPFSIYLEPSVRYVSRVGAEETIELDVEAFAEPITGTWPANETVTCETGQSDEDCMRSSYVNSDFVFQIPRLDIDEINQQLLLAGEPDRQIDQHMTGLAVVEIVATFDAGSLQDQAVLLLSAGGSVVAESEPTVIGIPATLTVSTEELLGAIAGEENATTSDIYYQTVDPNFRRTTLNQWLFNAGFASDFDGTLLPEAAGGEGEFAHVRYTNNFDLGFGRDMYTRVEPDGDVYAFVVNYPTLEAALKGTDEIVTVVMEFTPPDDPSLHASCLAKSRFVKFFTFAPDARGDSQRIGSMNFDGRGERPTPGNCVACHGGTVANLDQIETGAWGQPVYRDCGDTNATFMPWDLDSFLYSDTDPSIAAGTPRPDGTPLADYLDPDGRWTRAAQSEQFRKVNAAALSTYMTYVAEGGDPARVAAAIDLVHGWYQDQPNVAGTAFDGSYAPAGWDTSAEIENVYHEAFAPYCRACHTQLADSTKQFRTYDDLVINPVSGTPRELEDRIYRRGVMPLARLSMDRFWVPFEGGSTSAAQLLAEQLAADPRISVAASARPGAPVFTISRTPDPAKELDVVRLNASQSSFVEQPEWIALPSTNNGQCVQPTLIAANTLEVAFRATAPGRYCIELASGSASTIEEFEVAANQPPEEVVKARMTVDENAGPTSIDLEYADPDGSPSEVVFTLLGSLNGDLSLHGSALSTDDTFTQQQIDEGNVSFTPSLGVNLATGIIVEGGIDYSVTDGFTTLGPPAAAALEYRVDIRGVNDGQPSATVSPVSASEVFFGGSVVIGSSKIQVSDPDSDPNDLTISVAMAGAEPAGSVTPASRTYQQLLNGFGFTYQHAGAFPIDLADQISVTVSDGTFTSTPVLLTVSARVSFENNVSKGVIDKAGDAEACAFCHNSTGGGVGAPNFLNAGNSGANYTQVRTRVTLPENACSAPSAPSSVLLVKPTGGGGHTGGVRPGFDLGPGGDRDNYNLFREWICSFGAANN